MSSAVLDASALVDYLQESSAHPQVEAALADEGRITIVPHVCDLEVVSALRKLVWRGLTSPDHARTLLGLYAALPIERVDHLPLLGRIFALRDNFSPYDAAYVALAEALDTPFMTADVRLAEAVRRFTGVQVVVV